MIHPEASVDSEVHHSNIIWELVRIRENVQMGEHNKIGRNAYIDTGVIMGSYCKIQNNALIYGPCWIEDGVFIGPAAQIINDLTPRARSPQGGLMDRVEWIGYANESAVRIATDASIGAGAIIFPGVYIGPEAMVGAGAIVRKDVDAGQTVTGVWG